MGVGAGAPVYVGMLGVLRWNQLTLTVGCDVVTIQVCGCGCWVWLFHWLSVALCSSHIHEFERVDFGTEHTKWVCPIEFLQWILFDRLILCVPCHSINSFILSPLPWICTCTCTCTCTYMRVNGMWWEGMSFPMSFQDHWFWFSFGVSTIHSYTSSIRVKSVRVRQGAKECGMESISISIWDSTLASSLPALLLFLSLLVCDAIRMNGSWNWMGGMAFESRSSRPGRCRVCVSLLSIREFLQRKICHLDGSWCPRVFRYVRKSLWECMYVVCDIVNSYSVPLYWMLCISLIVVVGGPVRSDPLLYSAHYRVRRIDSIRLESTRNKRDD